MNVVALMLAVGGSLYCGPAYTSLVLVSKVVLKVS
jgi:hypothetical protein